MAHAAVLEGVGVGTAEATALAASMQFLLRDVCSTAAGIWLNHTIARRAGRDLRRWRLVADL